MSNPFDDYKDKVKYDFVIRGKLPYILKGGNEDQQNNAFEDFIKQIERLLNNEDYLYECFKDTGIARGRIYCKLETEDPELTILFGISKVDAEKELNKDDILESVKLFLEDFDSDIETVSETGLEFPENPNDNYEPAYVDFNKDKTKTVTVELIQENKEECLHVDINKELESVDKTLVNEAKLTFKNFVKKQESKLVLTDDGIIELYENNKLIKSQPFSKLGIVRECKELLQNGYILMESLSEEQAINITKSQAKANNRDQCLYKCSDGNYSIGVDKGNDEDCSIVGKATINPETNEVEWITEKVEESQIKIDKDTVIDTDEAKAEIEQATKDVDELQQMKDELNDKVDQLMEEDKENPNLDEKIINYYMKKDIIEDLPKDLYNIMTFEELDNCIIEIERAIECEEDYERPVNKEQAIEVLTSLFNDYGVYKPNEIGEMLLQCIDAQGKENFYYNMKTYDESMTESKEDVSNKSDKYKKLDAQLDKLISNDATDIELNDFLEQAAFDDDITNQEYGELQQKAQDTRRIDIKFPSTESTKRVLTANELKLIDLHKILNKYQLSWLEENIGNVYEIEDGLRNFVEMVGSVGDETVISLDNYFQSLKDEINK